MESKVTVLLPNARRQIIKVSPNTTLMQILEEACRKHTEFDCDLYILKHHNKAVPLTQTFRFSGLPNNCTLEMVEAETKRIELDVEICVQLEGGTRNTGQFTPRVTLWDVLLQLNPEVVETYENPVVLYMRQEIVGKERLMQTTLKSLGLFEGRAMLRFIDREVDELKRQANVYIPPTVKETPKQEEASGSGSRANKSTGGSGGGGGFKLTKDLVETLKKDANASEAPSTSGGAAENKQTKEEPKTEEPKYDWGTGQGRTMVPVDNQINEDSNDNQIKDEEMESVPEYNIIGERNAVLYSLEATQRAIEDLPDSFYDLTVTDLKLVLRDLKRVATGNEEQPLLTERFREMEKQRQMLDKIAHYKNCVIRIKFPDLYVLQGVFKPSDTVQSVVDFIKTFINNSNAKFYLFTIPPKTILPLEKNMLELNFVPTALLHFSWEDSSLNLTDQHCIKSEYLNKLTSAEGAIYAANKLRELRSTSPKKQDTYEYDELPGPSTGAIPKRPRT